MRQIVLLCALLAVVGTAVVNAMTPLLVEITNIVVAKEREMKEGGEAVGGGEGGKGVYATA